MTARACHARRRLRRSCGLDGVGQLPRMAGRERARAQGGGCCRDPGDGPSWSRAPGSDWVRQDGGACGQPLVPTAPQSRVQIFSNYGVLAGAPLRNRTVDLLLTIHGGFVRRRRLKSDYRSSEGSRCLGTSRCVGRSLESLSLTLSLSPGPSPFKWTTVGPGETRARHDHSAMTGESGAVPVSTSGLCRCQSKSVSRVGRLGLLERRPQSASRFSASWDEEPGSAV